MEPASSAPAYVRLERGAHPLARPEFDVGPLDPGHADRQPLDRLQALADAAARSRRAPRRPERRRLAELPPVAHARASTRRASARSAEDIARATAWLAPQGLEVHDVSPLGARVTFTGTVARSAGRVPHRDAPLPGRRRDALRDGVGAFDPGRARRTSCSPCYNTHDFYPRHVKPERRQDHPGGRRARAATRTARGNGIASAGLGGDLRRQPALQPRASAGRKINGTGVTIGIVGIAADRAERHQRVPHALRPARRPPSR